MTKLYLLTIKTNAKRFVPYRSLVTAHVHIMRSQNHYEWSSIVGVELDQLNRLHLHTTFTTPNTISVALKSKEWSESTGLHIHIQECKMVDSSNVAKYVSKEKRDVEELEEISLQTLIKYPLYKTIKL